MVLGWQAKVTKPGGISLFYKFKTPDIRKALIDIRKIDSQARFKDIKYSIFVDLALKMVQSNPDEEPIVSISVFNVGKETD